MPPDRVFRHVKKELCRNEMLLTPGDYYKILQNHGTVLTCESDWKVKDYKSVAKKYLKLTLPFKISQ